MGKAKSRAWTTGWTGNLRVYTEHVKREGARIVREVADEAAEDMRREIATSGTGWEGRAGRVVSGRMLGAVTADSKSTWGETRGNVATRTARFGWLKDYEDYFYYQEIGFNNKYKTTTSDDGGGPGETLGMQAFHQAFLRAGERLKEEVRNVRFR